MHPVPHGLDNTRTTETGRVREPGEGEPARATHRAEDTPNLGTKTPTFQGPMRTPPDVSLYGGQVLRAQPANPVPRRPPFGQRPPWGITQGEAAAP